MDVAGTLVGRLAVHAKLITEEQFREAVQAHASSSSPKPFGAFLLDLKLIPVADIQRLLEVQQSRLAAKLDSLYVETIHATVSTVSVPEELLKECLAVAADLRGRRFAFDILDLIRSRQAMTSLQVDTIRREMRKLFAICPVCLEATTARDESDATELACAACANRYSPSQSLQVLETLTIAHPESVPTKPEEGVLGEYRILKEVGRGGMGVVYEAEQIALKRRVALKVLPSAITLDKAALERFHREARLMAQLDHPNIVKVFGSGQSGDNNYYAMELIEGRGLDTLLHETRLDLRKTATWIRDIARALDYAHRHGLIHRDVKPANLLLDKAGRVVLTDFGLARSQESVSLTREGTIVGTPTYMSPEQARGERNKVDARSDIYSLAATFYHLATGRAPFRANTPEMIVHQVINDDADHPSRHNRHIDASLETIITLAMDKEAEKRYATAGLLADDLDHWLKGEPISARPLSRGERIARWIDHRRAIIFPVTSAVFVTLGAAGGVFWGLNASTEAIRKEEEGRAFAALADANKQATRSKEEADRRSYELDTLREKLEKEHAAQLADLERRRTEDIDRIRKEMEGQVKVARQDRLRAAADGFKLQLRERRTDADKLLLSVDPNSPTVRPTDAIDTLLRARAQFESLHLMAASIIEPEVRALLDQDPDWQSHLHVNEPLGRLTDLILKYRMIEIWAGWVIEHDGAATSTEIDALVDEHRGRPEPLLLRGLLHLREGRLKEAQETLLPLREKLPDEPRLFLALAECCILQKSFDEVGPFLDVASSAVPRPADYYYVRGLLFRAQDKLDEALLEFDSGLKSSRWSLDLVVGRAEILLVRSKPRDAVEAIEPILRTLRQRDLSTVRSFAGTSPGRRWILYDAFLVYARACLALDRKEEARRAAQDALRERPDDPAARDVLKSAGGM